MQLQRVCENVGVKYYISHSRNKEKRRGRERERAKEDREESKKGDTFDEIMQYEKHINLLTMFNKFNTARMLCGKNR